MFSDSVFSIVNPRFTGSNPGGCYLPAHHGDYYLYLGDALSRHPRNPPLVFEIHKLGIKKPILSLSDIENPNPERADAIADFSLDKRIHLIPEAKVLIVIPASNDRLILHRIDVEEALHKMKEEKK